MAQSRKDNKGRVLRKGETQRKCDGKYVYTYTDPEGRRKSIYSKDIKTLREREEQLIKDQLDGLDTYVAGSATVNFVFDRYISTKAELRKTTMTNYKYMYNRFVRDGFGRKKIAGVKFSDVLQFYQHLVKDKEMQINTLETIHTVLHPTFQLALRDNIIRTNPSDGVMAQIKMIKESKVTSINGKEIDLKADSICVHGDNAKALEFVKKIKENLTKEQIQIKALNDFIN